MEYECGGVVASTPQSAELAAHVRTIAQRILDHECSLFENSMRQFHWSIDRHDNCLVHYYSIDDDMDVTRFLSFLICFYHNDSHTGRSRTQHKDNEWLQKVLRTGTQADKRAAYQLRIQVCYIALLLSFVCDM
jgi:hypothetical protein